MSAQYKKHRERSLFKRVAIIGLVLFTRFAFGEVTRDYPEIVPVFSKVSFEGRNYAGLGRCTGTFIHPRLLLTAAHCLRKFNAEKMNGRIYRATDMNGRPAPDLTASSAEVYVLEKRWWGHAKVHPTRVHVSPWAVPVVRSDLSLLYVEQDLAILEFAKDVAPGVRALSAATPSEGTEVEQVGFGEHGPNGRGAPPKHRGFNRIAFVAWDSLVLNGNKGVCDDPSKYPSKYPSDWASCRGDSGGPLLERSTGAILGVTSTSTLSDSRLPGRKLSMYIDVAASESVKFIQSVIEGLH